MRHLTRQVCALAVAGAVGLAAIPAHAAGGDDTDQGNRNGRSSRTVFVVAMENHNWTQASSVTSPQQVFMNPEAPFLNSLVDGTSGISDQVAYATNYQNSGVGIHPSEPNYIWAEC